MREIKFRAWLKDKQVMKKIRSIEWAGIEVSSGFIKHIDTVNDRYYSKDYNDKGNYILMQYTGLEDANGKEIYEADILEETITNPQNGDELPYRKFLVFWAESYASFALKDLLNEDNYQETMWDIAGLKIVGNICENPELLESIINEN